MKHTIADHYSVLMEKVMEMIQRKLSKKQASLVSKFAQDFYSSVALEDMVNRNANEIYASLLNLWNYMQSRKDEACILRVINPELEAHGWHSKRTVIEILHVDMPFLIDSVRMELNRLGVIPYLIVHLPFRIERDAKGKIKSVERAQSRDEANLETPMYIEIERQSKSSLKKIKQGIESVLQDVRTVVAAWKPLRQKLKKIIADTEQNPPAIEVDRCAESISFLRWIYENHFTMLAYKHVSLFKKDKDTIIKVDKKLDLGLADKVSGQPDELKLSSLPKGAQKLAVANYRLLVLNKSSKTSTVHRPAYIDYVGIKEFNDKGDVIGEHRFYGLYTSAAYNLNPNSIPLLRQKIAAVLKASELPAHCHDRKALSNILETYPRDELFQISTQQLLNIGVGILHLQDRPLIKLFVRPDPFGRYFSCLVYVPREIYNTKLRIKMSGVLQRAFGGNVEPKFTTYFSESALARTHYIVPVNNVEDIHYDILSIEQDLKESARSWDDNLAEEIVEEFGVAQGTPLAKKYATAFFPGYKQDYIVPTAVSDIRHLESLSNDNPLSMSLYRAQEDAENKLRLKLFHRDTPMPLSEVLPLLENMGLKVIDESPYRVEPIDANTCWIMDFSLSPQHDEIIKLDEIRDVFQEALARAWSGEAEDDGFNRLVLKAGLDWRETSILRAYFKYMWQLGTAFSQASVEDTLAGYPDIALQLLTLFKL